jgi:hypothetical protein
MITTYDLKSFSEIEFDEPAVPEWMPEYAPQAELRLQTVAEDVHSLEAIERDFSAVIGAQALASLS